ncbi:sensor domain-containing protein [Rugosimonospora acidiphila]|uniref:histidine kinase n=1 Tax=Rugosimonospora acidiphila TaxID=556531 RepID=A0ABP9RSQ2_9ACTN
MSGPTATRTNPVTATRRARIGDRVTAAGRGAVLFLLTLPAMAAFGAVVLAMALMSVGIGLLLVPPAIIVLRRVADQRRRLAHAWQGIEVPSPYRPEPAEHRGGAAARVRHCLSVLRDPATWRDLLWSITDPVIGAALALLPIALILEGIYGFVITALWGPLTQAGLRDWYLFVHVTPANAGTAWATSAIGAALVVAGLGCAPALLRVNGRWARLLLAPTAAATMARRVQHLTETRADAVDTNAAELRRIERDLHDGAQSRLVVMGMNLNAAARLLERDPETARNLLLEARDSSAKALTEIRDLVRGIHPPVLADRGLVDAVRALALDSALPVEVRADPVGRLEAPLEAAAYFAIAEVLTNAAKHSRAERVRIEIHHGDGVLRMAVTDDGIGGASISAGTGLRGIERRLATFDGIIAVSSPHGGPTVVTMELPCASSSPKTSTSSGTA